MAEVNIIPVVVDLYAGAHDDLLPSYQLEKGNPSLSDVFDAIFRVSQSQPVGLSNRTGRLLNFVWLQINSPGALFPVHTLRATKIVPVGFVLSYDLATDYGELFKHQCQLVPLDTDAVIEAFTSFFEGDASWHSRFSWKPNIITVPPSRPNAFIRVEGFGQEIACTWHDPLPDQIVSMLRNAPEYDGSGWDTFDLRVLTQHPSTSYQAIHAGRGSFGFWLSYDTKIQLLPEDGSLEYLEYECENSIELDEVIQVAVGLLTGDYSWKYSLKWNPPFKTESYQPRIPPYGTDSISDRTVSSTSGVIYLLRTGSYYKIGKTNDPTRRYRELDIQLPERAERIHEISTNDIHRCERHWHLRFRDLRANGEWFQLSQEDVEEVKSVTDINYRM